MKSNWKWVILILGVFVVAFVAGLVLFIGLGLGRTGLVAPLFGRSTGMGWPWMMRRSPLGGLGMFGWVGGILRFLFWLGILVLIVYGVVRLLHTRTGTNNHALQQPGSESPTVNTFEPVASTPKRCAHCGKEVQPNWVVCPYCGGRIEPS